MDKDKRNSFTVEAPKPRNPFALHASQRRAAKFKDRREERGGARNRQRDYREEE